MLIAQRIFCSASVGLMLVGAVFTAMPSALEAIAPGHEVHIAATGSMAASGLGTGSLYVVEPVTAEEIVPGDMIRADSVFGFPIMHEATSAATLVDGCLSITMKGTSNPNADPAPYCVEQGAQRVVWGAAHLGTAYLWLSEHWLHLPETLTQVTLDGALDRNFALAFPGVLPSLIAIFATALLARRAVPSISNPSTLTTSDDESEMTDDNPESVERPTPVLSH